MRIAEFTKAMVNKDYKALAECFSDRCRLFDYCPVGAGSENFYIYGNRAVDMFYHNQFVLGGLSVMDPVIVDERTVNYYCNYGGVIVHAVATIERYEACDGRIGEMVIRPA